MPFLFYAVPDSNPHLGETVFTDRFWDEREHWFSPGVGLVYKSLKPYFGPIPGPEVGPQEGTADQWREGVDYQSWIDGAFLHATCWPIAPFVLQPRARQAQKVFLSVRLRTTVRQVQRTSAGVIVSGFPAPVQQAQQALVLLLAPVLIAQSQTLEALFVLPPSVQQSQTLPIGVLPPSTIRQVQATFEVPPFVHLAPRISQVQRVTA